MVYGFISSLDDETTKVFFRSKKIRGNNIYCAGSLGALTFFILWLNPILILAMVNSGDL